VSEGALREFLARVEPELAALDREASLAYWEATTGGGPEAEARCAAARERLARRLSDRRDHAFLASADPSGDPVLDRQATLLRLAFAANQLDEATLAELVRRETEIEGLFTRFRARLRGREASDNELREVLERSPDPALRREAWEASKQVGAAVAPRLRELVELRNRAARRLGHPDHYTMALELQEIEPGPLLALLDELRRRTDAPFAEAKAGLDQELAERFSVSPEAIRPWHYADPFFQDAPPAAGLDLDRLFEGRDAVELARRFYDGLGLPVGSVLDRSDLYERPGKQQHAYCIDVDRAGDVRVLMNVRPGERWASTALHELGHAVHDLYHDPGLPWLLRTPAHIATTEAVAQLMGRLTKDATWLARIAGVPEGEALAAAEAVRGQLRLSQLIFVRWGLVMVAFERELYQDPAADLDARWWELVASLQGVAPPEGRRAPDWAAKIHLGTVPVYYQNYLLGEMAASQLQSAAFRDTGADTWVDAPAAGAWLRDRVFRPGARWRWDELLRRATGEPLNPEHHVAQFVDRPA
jgi:peptidyl-dipeptidase A